MDEQAKPVPAPAKRSAIGIQGLTVTAGSRVLLRDLDAVFPAGQVSVIVGPSGVGKSILLKIIAGLIQHRCDGVSVTGSVRLGDKPVRPGMAGVVFQTFALFDELTPEANINFAATCGKGDRKVSAADWLKRLGVPADVPTSRLSGGQRQRLALARTLAYDPQVILYDEPTSGLDPATGRHVAELIHQTNDEFGKTSIVVTHDYPAWLPVADHVFLFDPSVLDVHEVPREEWENLPKLLDESSQAVAAIPAVPVSERTGLLAGLGRAAGQFLAGTTDAVLSLFVALVSLLPVWRNPVWGLRFLWHYTMLICGPTAILYLLMAGLINGYVSTFFTFEFFPFATYTEPLLIEDLLEAIGFLIYRVLVPILACILVAARCGAAVTADVGGRQYGEQLSAMSTFNASPRAYLLTAIMVVFLFGTPLLTMVAWYGSQTASLLAFVWSHPERGPDFWDHYFHVRLIHDQAWMYQGVWWMLAKVAVSGLGVGAVAWRFGISPKYSPSDVSRSVTRTILWATLLVLTIHFVFALYEFESLRPKLPDGIQVFTTLEV